MREERDMVDVAGASVLREPPHSCFVQNLRPFCRSTAFHSNPFKPCFGSGAVRDDPPGLSPIPASMIRTAGDPWICRGFRDENVRTRTGLNRSCFFNGRLTRRREGPGNAIPCPDKSGRKTLETIVLTHQAFTP